MSSTNRTIYGSVLQTTQYAKTPFSLVPNTTLNEKFNVQAGIVPPTVPSVGYYCIGNGGHKLQTGANGLALIQALSHSATDAALYSHLPFVLRPVTNDLTITERAKYILRTQVSYNSQNYIAYYGKRLDMSSAQLTMKIQTNVNGTTTTASFVPAAANLSPTPPTINNTGVNPLAGQYALVSSTLGLALTAAETQEIINAATIIYGDPAYAIISEIGMCSGVDKAITLSNGDTFQEAIAVQITSHVSTFHLLQSASNGVTGTLQIGSAEPMLVLG